MFKRSHTHTHTLTHIHTLLQIITQSGNILKADLAADTGIEVELIETGVTVFSTESNVFNLTESDLFPAETRVYFLNMYPVHARRIMCKVRERRPYLCILPRPHTCTGYI